MSEPKAHVVGINHVALEVGDIDAALAFYGRLFEVRLRGRSATMAFIDMGDQFLALSETKEPHQDRHRHVGLRGLRVRFLGRPHQHASRSPAGRSEQRLRLGGKAPGPHRRAVHGRREGPLRSHLDPVRR